MPLLGCAVAHMKFGQIACVGLPCGSGTWHEWGYGSYQTLEDGTCADMVRHLVEASSPRRGFVTSSMARRKHEAT